MYNRVGMTLMMVIVRCYNLISEEAKAAVEELMFVEAREIPGFLSLRFLTVLLPFTTLPVKKKKISAICYSFYGSVLRGQILLCRG